MMNWEKCYELSKQPEGRAELQASEASLISVFESALIHFLEEAHVISYIRFWERLILLRNFCVSENAYVRAMMNAGIIDQLLLLCRFISLRSSSDSSAAELTDEVATSLIEDDIYSFVQTYPEEYIQKIIRVISQLVANMTACSPAAKRQIFHLHLAQRHEDRHRGSLSDLAAAAMLQKDKVSLNAIWMTIINMIATKKLDKDDKSNTITIDHIYSNESGRTFMKQLILSLHSHDEKSRVDEKGDMIIVEGNAEGCQLLCMNLLTDAQLHHLLPFFQSLGPKHVQPADAIINIGETMMVSLEQVLFLFVLVSVVEEDRTARSVVQSHLLSTSISQFILHISQLLSIGLSSSLLQYQVGADASQSRDIFKEFNASIFQDYCVVSIHLLSSFLCLLEDSSLDNTGNVNAGIIKREMSTLLLPILAERILIGKDPVSKRSFDPKKRSSILDEGEVSKSVLWSREMVRRSLQLASLLVIRSPESQEILLTTPRLLGSLLQHCATDFENPLAREWALLVVRNLCEDNDKARSQIDALRPQEVVQLSGDTSSGGDILQEEAFRQAGLTVNLDPRTGKLSVERKNDEAK